LSKRSLAAAASARSPALPEAEAVLAPVRTLPGVGPSLSAALARLLEVPAGEVPRRVDLLWHLPYAAIARELRAGLAGVSEGERVTVEVQVQRHQPSRRPRQPYRIRCAAGDEALQLVFFNARESYLQEVLPPQAFRVVSGPLSRYGARWQMIHPELITTREGLSAIGPLEPIYPCTQGVGRHWLGRLIARALEDLGELPEWHDPAWLAEHGWPGFADALRAIHRPCEPSAIEPASAARRRLAFDELFANQLALQLVRRHGTRQAGRAVASDGHLRRKVLAALPFALTSDQTKALAEIAGDMARPQRMLRLLQGDVGSGKTLVALLAMLNAVEAGCQAALLAPTELLARQHARTLGQLLAPAGIEPVVLTGRERGAERTRLLGAVADGRARVVVGTHAIFQAGVGFCDLALAVIDEQHRFGVQQRMQLMAKGRFGDLLVMTATPIPRTLVLSLYGDMAVSDLREKPPGRKPVRTRVVPLQRLDRVLAAVERALEDGEQLYWVCPRVEADEDSDVAAAVERHEALRERFGRQVGLVHGRLAAADKDRAMAGFASGEHRILVATTVIEVGVDVPEAGVMVIERAECFGLAQLHQLRGRVGRGERPATCLLLCGSCLSPTARARLEIMRSTGNGFRIAEEDLKLRGPGELLGTRQSGVPAFRLADLAAHADLLQPAHDAARLALNRDPALRGKQGPAIRLLLRLFGREATAGYLRSG
jgi:ATP-dependent DNA helicase RecG